MNFKVGDIVMHWNHGLGQIMALEERRVMGESQLYYAVQTQDINIWVPADAMLAARLRLPTSAQAFAQLHAKMTDGQATSRCHVIRDLTTLEEEKSLNEDDRSILKRARTMLLREWGYSLKVPLAQAEDELQELLSHSPAPTQIVAT
jgi:CarD family transcriptional regulator